MIRKIAIIGGVLLVLLLLGGLWAQQFAQTKIEEALRLTSETGDSVRFAKLDFNLFSGSLDIDDVIVAWSTADSSDANKLQYRFDGNLQQVQVRGIDVWAYLFDKKYEARSIHFLGPELTVLARPDTTQNTTDSTRQQPKKKSTLHLAVGEILVGPTRVKYIKPGFEQPLVEIDSLEVKAADWVIDMQDSTVNYLPTDLAWTARNFVYRHPDNLQVLHIGEAEASGLDSVLRVKDIRAEPQMSAQQQWQKYPKEAAWINATIASMNFFPIDWAALFRENKLKSRLIEVAGLHLEVLENEALSYANNSRKVLYQEKLLESSLLIDVDSIQLTKSRVDFEIIPKRDYKNGKLTFSDLYATLYDVTNDSAKVAAGQHTLIDVRTRFNNESVLNVHFDFDLNSPQQAFSYQGNVENFAFSALNSILEPTAYMRIPEGKIQRFDFSVNSSQYVSRGEANFRYDDLKVEWLEGHNILGALGQKVFMRERNPKGDDFRPGRIYFKRGADRSFWHFFYKSIVSGIQSTVVPNLFLPDELEVDGKERRKERRAAKQSRKRRKR